MSDHACLLKSVCANNYECLFVCVQYESFAGIDSRPHGERIMSVSIFMSLFCVVVVVELQFHKDCQFNELI